MPLLNSPADALQDKSSSQESDSQIIERLNEQKLYKGDDGKAKVARTTHLPGIKNANIGLTKFYSGPTGKESTTFN